MYTRDRGDRLTWVHKRIYAAGGDHVLQNWALFQDQTGISAILHLDPEGPAKFHGPSPVAYMWMRVDREAEITIVDRWMAGSFISECVGAHKHVLIHSSKGRHRVRWVFVSYLIVSGQSVKAALREAEEKPWQSPYHTDLNEWHTFFQFVRSKS